MAEDLSQQERDLIANLIRDGKPVPARYIPSISDNPLKTEMIWPGKTSSVDTSVLPFQSIEHIDEPRKDSGMQLDLFSINDVSKRQSGGWTNKLIWGDNALILSSLVYGPYRDQIEKSGGLKLIYIDPPFDVGADFSMDVEVGEESVKKTPSVIEQVAYRDTWGRGADSFNSMIFQRLRLMRELLSDDGTIYVHCDYRVVAHIRLIMDEIFGADHFINQIEWTYKTGGIPEKVGFSKKHDHILVYSKTKTPIFNQQFQKSYVPTLPEPHTESGKNLGVLRDELCDLCGQGSPGQKYRMVIARDVWDDIPSIFRNDQQGTGYPTQKPEGLLQRILSASSNEGDLVGDFFCGSGTTLAVAEKMGRKWIGVDLGRFAIHTSRKRLISIQRNASQAGESFRAFEILNLGGYERVHQVGIDPSLSEIEKNLQASIKREEFVELVLSAYGAQKSDQLPPFSGSKGGTAILIGGIDSAVTQDQVQQAIDTALSTGISRVDVLGFEFEMGISPAMSDAAKEQGLTLAIRYIPNEVFDKRAIAKDQVAFYEAGYVEALCKVNKKELIVNLTDFGVFYRQDDADETAVTLRNGNAKVVVDHGQVVRVAKDKKGVITKENLTSNWQDWIDYWAIDFDFSSQPEVVTVLEDGKEVRKRTGKYIFENEWQAFRSRGDRSLELTSTPYEYAQPGSYSVAVKVIDIFGNDTTRVFKIMVK